MLGDIHQESCNEVPWQKGHLLDPGNCPSPVWPATLIKPIEQSVGFCFVRSPCFVTNCQAAELYRSTPPALMADEFQVLRKVCLNAECMFCSS